MELEKFRLDQTRSKKFRSNQKSSDQTRSEKFRSD